MTTTTGITRQLGLVLATALALALVPADATEAAAAVSACERVDEETFRVTTTWDRATYRVREKARFEVLVERDLKATLKPVEGVDVAVAVDVGGRVVFNTGITNEAGVAQIGVRLKPHLPSGKADVGTLAFKEYVNEPCVLVREFGRQILERAFAVKR